MLIWLIWCVIDWERLFCAFFRGDDGADDGASAAQTRRFPDGY